MSKFVKGFDQIHSANIGATSTVELFSVTVPHKLKLLVTHFANPINNVAALGNLTWKVLRNGIATSPLDAVLDQYGDISDPYELSEPIEFFSGSTVSVVVVNSSGVAYDAGVLLRGSYFTVE